MVRGKTQAWRQDQNNTLDKLINVSNSISFQWFGLLIILLYRFVIAAFCSGGTIWSGLYYRESNVKWFIYLTNWSFFFVTLYFICATMVTAIHYKNQRETRARDQSEKESENGVKMTAMKGDTCEPRDNLVTSPVDVESEVVFAGDALEASRATPMRWYHEALWVIYNIASVAALVVTLSFWLLIYGAFRAGGTSPISVIFHAVNSILMVFDTILSSVPVRLFHVVYPMLYSIAYIMFTVIYWASGGTNSFGLSYIYPQTDYTGRPVLSAVSLVCLFFIGLPLCQSLMFGFYCLRVWIKTKCLK